MKMTAINDGQVGLPALGDDVSTMALIDELSFLNSRLGPILRATSFFGMGALAGGAYSGHSELVDLDGLLRDFFGQPSMEPGVNDTLFGGGKGFDLPSATLSSVGEAVERVGAALVSCDPSLPSERITASHDEMVDRGLPALSPDDLHLFSEQQYDSDGFLYERFDRQSTVQWIKGHYLASGQPIHAPAQLVDMLHIYDPAEDMVGYPVSGGLSTHITGTIATVNGLCEVLERDAINMSWYTDALPGRLALDDTLPQSVQPFLRRLVGENSRAEALVHPTAVPGVACVSFISQQDWMATRRYCAGGACEVSPTATLMSAAVEHGQARSTIDLGIFCPRGIAGMTVERMFDWDPERTVAEMELFIQAIGYYGIPEHEGHLDGYLDGEVIPWADIEQAAIVEDDTEPEAQLEALVRACRDVDLDPIVFDYSMPGWNQLETVKVFVPEVTTPFLQSRPMLGHPRLGTLRDAVIDPSGIPLPLPYP